MADNTYRILTKIAETGSLTRTAEQLNYTQARVSQILKSAETELDRKSTRLNSSHESPSRMPSSA